MPSLAQIKLANPDLPVHQLKDHPVQVKEITLWPKDKMLLKIEWNTVRNYFVVYLINLIIDPNNNSTNSTVTRSAVFKQG